MVIFYFLGRFIANRIVRKLQEAKGDSLFPDMEALVYRFSVFGSLFVGFSVVLQFIFGVDFLQVVGFFGLGISLAFKDMLSNVIAGAVIIIQNRIRIGDFIKVGTTMGKVLEIQSRVTILKSIQNAQIIIPNSVLMNSNVINYTYHSSRRIDFQVVIPLEVDFGQAQKIILNVVGQKDHVLKKPDPKILTSIKEGHYHLKVLFWVDPQDKKKSWLITRSELVQEVTDALKIAGIAIPYPTFTYLEGKEGGHMPMHQHVHEEIPTKAETKSP